MMINEARSFAATHRRSLGLPFAYIVVFAFFSIFGENFLALDNVLSVVRLMSVTGIIGIGMTMVIVTGEIDLSVGSLVALSGMVFGAQVVFWRWNIYVAGTTTLCLGVMNGLLVGTLRNRYKIPAFISTLTLQIILRGLAFVIYPMSLSPYPESFKYLANGHVGVVPSLLIILLVLYLAGYVFLFRSRHGREIFAVGANETAARYAGVRVELTRTLVFVIVGVLSSFAGILMASNQMSSLPNIAKSYELTVIAGVIVGGASLSGGAGSLFGTFIGMLLVQTIANGMVLMGLSSNMQFIVQGLIILVAVLINAINSLGFRGVSKDIA
jgi:ribose transport system permease protein